MRKLLKAAALGALLVPAVLGGAAGVAAADGPAYAQHSAVATPWGAGSSHVMSGFGGWDHGERGGQRMDRGDSGPGYVAGDRYAGPDGAWAKATGSGFTPDGDAYHFDTFKAAGPNGAVSSFTGAHS
ncbi:hypothetical protein [Streptomyces koyangensis]|uniref:Uncharacterized protein n=1 Tax=Streptomyces koyangensis TaxID=188770 RepID=A0ABX7EG38_9ACTN|nr:hypothetical protein [Streptomyces koyangensis]QRF03719.1 hypothetical protein G9U55_17040 [Streptomyces koyangensis]